jgi:hypothetical protein
VQLELRRRLLQHRQQRARRAHHHRRRRHVPRRECRSAAAEVLGLVGCRRRGASSSSPAGAGGVVWGRISGGVGACAFAAVRGARLAWSRRRSRIRCGGEAPGAPTQIYGISEGVFRNLPAALVAESDAKHILLGFVFVFSFRRRISPAVYDIGCYKFFFQQRALYKVFGESATQKKKVLERVDIL